MRPKFKDLLFLISLLSSIINNYFQTKWFKEKMEIKFNEIENKINTLSLNIKDMDQKLINFQDKISDRIQKLDFDNKINDVLLNKETVPINIINTTPVDNTKMIKTIILILVLTGVIYVGVSTYLLICNRLAIFGTIGNGTLEQLLKTIFGDNKKDIDFHRKLDEQMRNIDQMVNKSSEGETNVKLVEETIKIFSRTVLECDISDTD